LRNDPEGTVLGVPRRAVLVTWEGHLDVATELFRVVVVSREPVPVTTVLRFKVPGCLPVAVPSVEDVAPKLSPEAIVLIDLGNDGASLAAARKLRQQGIEHGMVVIGSSGTGGASGSIGLQPPFELDDLAAAMHGAREHSARAATSQEGGPAVTGTAEDATPAARAPAAQDGPPSPPTGPATTSTEDPPAPPRAGADLARGKAEAPQEPVAEPPPAPAPVHREPSTTVPQVALDAVTSVDESLFSSKTPAHPGAPTGGAGSPGEPLRSKVERWRKRLAAPASGGAAEPTQRELHERLVQIFAATSQIESIAAELPIVTDRGALYQAIVMAVADEFTADSVALWRAEQDKGWFAAAHLGLTEREVSLPVEFEQPVLHDVDARAGAVLLDPTSSFQGLISGIGGSHTESFMAAAIAIGPHRLGILTVGRDEPLVEADLDRLVEMAAEAAVGIGVAEHIERMSTLVGQMRGDGSSDQREPGQWREAFLDELKSAWHARREGDEAAPAGGAWSALATSAEQDADQDAGQDAGQDADQDADQDGRAGVDAADEPDTVIDLTSRAVKRA